MINPRLIMNKKSKLKELREDFFTPTVDRLIKEHYSIPPEGLLEPKNVWQGKIRAQLMDALSGEHQLRRIRAGFQAIAHELKAKPQLFEKVSVAWEHGIEKWAQQMEALEKTHPTDTLFQILGLSEEILEEFYQAANHYFHHKEYEKAADALYAIASLDPTRFNVWIAFGISEAKLGRIESALVAFSFATMINMKSPYPYLYSAQVCIQASRTKEAKIYLNLAKEAIEHHPELKDAKEKYQKLNRIVEGI